MQRCAALWVFSAACFLVIASSAAPARAQLYTPYAQERSLDVRADAQVPPQTSAVVTDGRREESEDLGSFDRSLSAAAAAGAGPGQPPYAAAGAVARQSVTFTPTSITGLLSTDITFAESGGWTGGSG